MNCFCGANAYCNEEQPKLYANVLDMTDNQVKVMRLPIDLYKKIKSYSDAWPEVADNINFNFTVKMVKGEYKIGLPFKSRMKILFFRIWKWKWKWIIRLM